MLCATQNHARLLELEAREGKPISLVSNWLMDTESGEAVIHIERTTKTEEKSKEMIA